MVRGFYLALDKKVSAFAGRFWRTTRGNFVPMEHILVHRPKTEFQGVWNKADTAQEPSPEPLPPALAAQPKIPVAFVLGFHAWQWNLDGEKPRRTEKVERFTILPLNGKRQLIEQRAFYESTEGFWLRDLDVAVAKPSPVPPDLAPGEKWIEVNLATQTLIAYEGEKPVFATLVSSGRHNDDDKAKDYHTPTGDFRVREKHVSTTMDDDSASDGPYQIQDVPWVMYFNRGIALHGAFWHASFGHERSHGCVNLQPQDAKALFQWAGPNLPDGWHAVRATASNPGTRVIVRDPRLEEPGGSGSSGGGKGTGGRDGGGS
jgi:hypothetical protein